MFYKVKTYLPHPIPAVLYAVAWGILVVGIVIGIAYSFDTYEGRNRYVEASFFVGIVILPLCALLTEIAALIEKTILAKLVFGLTASAALLLAAVAGGIGLTDDMETANIFIGMSTCFGPLIVASLIVPIYSLFKLPHTLRDLRETRYERQVLELINENEGEVSYAQLGQALHLSEEQVDDVLKDLVANNRIAGFREPEYRRFYTVPTFTKRQLTLLGMVEARGAVSISEMAREFRVDRGLIKEWLYALVHRDKFTGYINWEEEMLYSAEASQLRATGKCPNCGGAMGMAGKGVVHCAHCGTEVYLPSAG